MVRYFWVNFENYFFNYFAAENSVDYGWGCDTCNYFRLVAFINFNYNILLAGFVDVLVG